MSSDALRFHTQDAINVTASVDIWAACPDCGKSLQFYSGQVCDSLSLPRNVATCPCGSWMLRADVAITKHSTKHSHEGNSDEHGDTENETHNR